MKKIHKISILRLLEVLAIAEPPCMIEINKYIHDAWRLLFYLCLFLVFIEVIKTGITTKMLSDIWLPLAIYTVILFSTVIHKGENKEALMRMITYCYCVILISLCRKKGNLIEILKILRNVLLILIILNFISIVVFPKGMYQRIKLDERVDTRYWFLGFKNGIGKYCIFSIVTCFAYQSLLPTNKGIIATILAVITSVGSTVLIHSGSGIVGVVLLTLGCIYIKSKSIRRLRLDSVLRGKKLAWIVVFLFITIVISDILLTNVLVQQFVTNILGKTITFTGRTDIWSRVLTIIQKNWLLGIGVQPGNKIVEMISLHSHATDAHDYYLEFFMEGGIFSFALIILFLRKIVIYLNKYKHNNVSKIFTVCLFTLMIVLLVENCNNVFLWLYYGLCMNCDQLEEKWFC